MLDVISVNNIEDKSVDEKMQQVAEKLTKKYKKKRKINERLMQRTKPQKVMSLISDILLSIIIVFTLAFGISTVNARLQGVAPSFAGYSVMRVASGSMTKSGFGVGQNIVIRHTDTKSLKPGDMIAFYTYPATYYGVRKENFKQVSASEIQDEKNTLTLLQFFGVQGPLVSEAAHRGATLTFHHIRDVFEDENGTRWFSTYGSSNYSDDSWLIREELVIGKYDGSLLARGLASVLQLGTSMAGLVLLISLPVLLLMALVIKWCLHNVQVAKLELDVVEEKRKLTDKICVDNEVGYGMATQTKYKVLAQAEPDEINEYLQLLWRDGTAPKQIRKYYLRKARLIAKMSEMLNVHRTCEQMIRDGEPAVKIAKFYSSSRARIEKDYKATKKQLKKIKKTNSETTNQTDQTTQTNQADQTNQSSDNKI